jgi:4-amino-4-deoxy-L-arabinose transferase-like glycosyltransferase
MLERNDWIVPTFNGELRSHKPILQYWLMMTSYAAFGVNEFAARFWSAALGVGTVLLSWRMGCRLFSPAAGFWAGLCLTPALMFNVAARAATPDSLLIFCVTAFFCLVVEWFLDPESGFTRPLGLTQIFALYGVLGLAALAKGPVGLVLPLMILGITLLGDRCLRSGLVRDQYYGLLDFVAALRQMRLGWGLLAFLLVAAPWYVWVGYRTDGAFLNGFFWEHNVRRATEAMENHHGSPLWFYPVTLLAGFFPASIFAIPTVLFSWQQARAGGSSRSAVLFCTSWIAVFVGLFSLVNTKLPSYVTPCYPALALLTGATVAASLAGNWRFSAWWERVSYASLFLSGVATLPLLYFVAQRYLPGAEAIALVALPLVLGGAIALGLVIGQWRQEAAAVGLGGGLLFSMLLFGQGAVTANAYQQQQLLFDATKERVTKAELASWNCLESSWVFYFGSPIHELPHGGREEGISRLAQYLSEGDDRYVIVRRSDWNELAPALNTQAVVVAEAPYFLKQDTLVLVASPATIRVARQR